MAGLGTLSPGAWAAAAPAGAIWLAETSSPATARTAAISAVRILDRRTPWMMFTEVFLSCCCDVDWCCFRGLALDRRHHQQRAREVARHDASVPAGTAGRRHGWPMRRQHQRRSSPSSPDPGRWSLCPGIGVGCPWQDYALGVGVFASVGSLAGTPVSWGVCGWGRLYDGPGGAERGH